VELVYKRGSEGPDTDARGSKHTTIKLHMHSFVHLSNSGASCTNLHLTQTVKLCKLYTDVNISKWFYCSVRRIRKYFQNVATLWFPRNQFHHKTDDNMHYGAVDVAQ
jgi:hypothetical protein